ncbi:MAG: hypothetical protein NTV17_11900, partial [Burkholderiales bacterium]|nr:hypothetical protein [Burkholderiales bacterium]
MIEQQQDRQSSKNHCPDQNALARPHRRTVLKVGASSLALATSATHVSANLLPSPPTTPFLESMPVVPELPASAAPGAVGANASFAANHPTLTPNRA